MSTPDPERLRSIKTFASLVKYLRDELDWPIDSEDFDDLTFDYQPEELGLDAKTAVKIREIKQLRPLVTNQPWGIFFLNFEPKRLPVVVLRRILRALVLKKRQSANRAHQATWQLNDLLFISSYGEAEHRDITLAHFSEEPATGDPPSLKVLGWDDEDTVLHLAHAHETLEQKLRWPREPADLEGWRSTWSAAFTLRHREVITTSKALAVRMAELATAIRKRFNRVVAVESDKGPLRKLHAAFKEALIHDLSEDDFADMYAQTITYGLLSARVSRPAGLIAENVADMVPVTNPFLRDMLSTFLTVGGRKGTVDFDELGINDVVQALRDANMEAVLRDFGDKNPQEDPVVHFYELFLKQYDPRKRIQRGVFYTPRPVVSFIVRSVDVLLRTEFGLADGLADTTTWSEMARRHEDLKIPEGVSPDQDFVQILDPATGTGTFLVEAIDLIHKTLVAKWKAQGHGEQQIEALWNEYVPKHLLPRLHGYELLMAPYAIAHLKIGLKLYETGYRFGSDERARVYLTNALEPASDDKGQREFQEWAPALAHEAQAVNAVKRRQRFTVIIGNPPYAAASHNPSVDETGQPTYIGRLIRPYFEIDGEPLRESNPRWLQDDYVKFFRLAESLVEDASTGVVGMITNHGYLANPTFRGMRHSLLRTNSTMRVLDLHGNSKRGERAPDGSTDENVFDIQQGVAIALLNRAPRSATHSTQLCHGDLYGTRQQKYHALTSEGLISWQGVRPAPPFFLLLPQDEALRNEFNAAITLPSIFLSTSVGIVTGRDALTIHFTRAEAVEMAEHFTGMPAEAARRQYDLGPDSRDWRVAWAQSDLKSARTESSDCTPITYRPFDVRFTFYTGHSRGFHCMPRGENMRHMVATANLGLVTARSNKSQTPDHFYCSRFITEAKCGEATTQSCLFPLYLAPDEGGLGFGTSRRIALAPTFLALLAKSLGAAQGGPERLPSAVCAENIFHYAYAVFHSPGYRSRYAEFLKIDFPRLPLTGNAELFRALTRLGGELVGLHLLESPKLEKHISVYSGRARSEVEKVSYARDSVWLDKAQTCGFRGVPEAAWNFHIGGYQVCEKWLKDRKGRTLSEDDIAHYQKIVVALAETIRLMKEIDEVIEQHGGWPAAFIGAPAANGQPAGS